MDRDRDLTTADLARGNDDMRGRGDDRLVAQGEQALAESPRPSAPAQEPPSKPAASRPASTNSPEAVLFTRDDASQLHGRWTDIQGAFVDEPRKAVERADSLVAEVMKKLAESFAQERAGLERQWDRGDNVTTEDLRIALQRYRSFFDRLLKV
jgi:hypothetical protein